MYATFANEEEFIGKTIIEELIKIENRYKFNLFEAKIRIKHFHSDIIPNFTERFNQSFINSNIRLDTLEKIYICGPSFFCRDIHHYLINNKIEKNRI